MSDIFSRINRSYEKFRKFLVYNKTTGTERKNFPVAEACQFSKSICDMNNILNRISGGRLDNMARFSQALIVIAKSLHKKEGIEAFAALLDTLLLILKDAVEHESQNWQLASENRELRQKVSSLEAEIANMEDSISVNLCSLAVDVSTRLVDDETGIEEDKSSEDVSNDESQLSFLFAVQENVSFSNREDVLILETYLAHASFNPDTTVLVILFESSEELKPPTNSFAKWHQISSNSSHSPELEYDEWIKFAQSQPEDHRQLLIDFVDPICTRVISDYDDIVGVMPFAYRTDGMNRFEPALQVVKKLVGYNAARSPLPPVETDYMKNGFIVLSDGRTLKVCEKEGWFCTHMQTSSAGGGGNVEIHQAPPDISIGGGMSSPDCENDYGSIGGFAVDKNGDHYVVTCEHVVVEARRREKAQPVFLQSKKTKFVFPSEGPRKFQLISASAAINEQMKLNPNFWYCLLNKFDTPAWRVMLGIDSDRDITLRDIKQFLTHDQTHIAVPNTDVYEYSCTPCELEYGHGIKILAHGDLAAIKLPQDIFNKLDQSSFEIRSKPVIGVVTMRDMFAAWCEGTHSIPVYKAGVNETPTRIQGKILKSGNFKAPINTIFVDEYPSKTLKEGNGDYKILLAQYVVSAPQSFGRGGDSGGVVYCDATDGMHIVGTYVGSFNDSGLFAVAPAEVLMRNGTNPLNWLLHAEP
jgi:hypothetical protein